MRLFWRKIFRIERMREACDASRVIPCLPRSRQYILVRGPQICLEKEDEVKCVIMQDISEASGDLDLKSERFMETPKEEVNSQDFPAWQRRSTNACTANRAASGWRRITALHPRRIADIGSFNSQSSRGCQNSQDGQAQFPPMQGVGTHQYLSAGMHEQLAANCCLGRPRSDWKDSSCGGRREGNDEQLNVDPIVQQSSDQISSNLRHVVRRRFAAFPAKDRIKAINWRTGCTDERSETSANQW